MKRLFLIFAAALLCATSALANLTFTRTTTGATTSKTYEQGLPRFPRLVEIRATGTWGGTTITVQSSSDGGTTWVDAGVSMTADGTDYAYLVPGDLVRVTATGGTGINLIILIR